MNSRERVMAALVGGDVDRAPYTLWRDFPDEDQDPESLARATLDFARRWQVDLVIHTPNANYAVEDWGAASHGPDEEDDAVEVQAPGSLGMAEGWRSLPHLSTMQGALARELKALRRVREGLEADVPLVMTVFSPLTLAAKLVGVNRLLADIRDDEEALLAGLHTIAQSVSDFALAVLDAGADGLFFASQLATERLLPAHLYTTYGERFDQIVLQAVRARTSFIILHLHGSDVFFDLVNRYPVDAVSWDDRAGEPTLPKAMGLTLRGLVAGIDREAFLTDPGAVRGRVQAALDMTGGRRLIVAPSGAIPSDVSDEALQAVRDEIERWTAALPG